ncbi:MAG: apolipoprotein N-acyltransferase [Puniceicoccaceae bacterium]|nr:MAG: apolipoprotein N-acyltransferase [Puniceicoccaceae bacterium]
MIARLTAGLRGAGQAGIALLVAVATGLLTAAAFPPMNVAEAAYIFVVPALAWAAFGAPWRWYLPAVGVGSWAAWIVLIFWLRHVTPAGMVALSLVLALFPLAWLAAARWALPRMVEAPLGRRLAATLGLAGLWVVLEWIRSWLFTGFPWLPLAASQWERPLLLQSAAWTGAWGVSFVLIVFNLGLAAYFRRLEDYFRRRKNRFVPEFYLALLLLFLASFGFFRHSAGREAQEWLRVGLMQPNIPQDIKWEEASAPDILAVLTRVSQHLLPLEPDVILWPEAVTPYAVVGHPGMRHWVEETISGLGVPVVMGGITVEDREEGESLWRNAALLVRPDLGVAEPYYRKRHLVPFGEYVPLRRWLPWLEKFVPIGGDFTPGTEPVLLPIALADRTIMAGPLICYEDVFPRLARETVRAGAAVLVVVTNNAWFGEEGAAYQHAAHSVLRAVETRRPVLRCGNAGWSGWIDESGVIRHVLTDADGSIYFRGASVAEVWRDQRWRGVETFYVRFGDWFVGLGGVLVLLGYGALHGREPEARSAAGDSA